ncbi:unnamed protein product [Mytilus edulis]|uniref:Uncharacterized protein n=1 Tax=Mytilus edulis TaxID=6550 RepID=A0A8S3UGZ4_MYTED|nr:unnamed protein product [Mytilus edulis]
MSDKKVTMELSDLQLETIKHLFGHNDWEIKILDDSAVAIENGGNAQNLQMTTEQSTQTDNNDEDEDDEDNDQPGFVIQQDPSKEECRYCFCRPCITDDQNRQMWWHGQSEVAHQRNSSLRKEHYKRFWTMLLHRGAWNDDRYMLMKADAMTRDHRSQRFDWHKRDIMPKCVVTLVRCWFPNPGLPAEIRALDKDAAKVFTHLLEEESYPHFESRVMLAGEQGTGKTTIARYLVGKGPTRVRKSTDGIGLYTGLSYMDRETNTWLNGKQDFSLADVTISRSLRQKPLGPQVSSLSPELLTDLTNKHEKSPTASASVRFNEQQVIDKDRYKMPRIPAEKDTSRLKEHGHGNKPTKRIPDNKQSTNISLDLYKHQYDPNEIETQVQKQHRHHQDETQLQNVPLT